MTSPEASAAFRLVAETEAFLVIDKAPGVSFHRQPSNAGGEPLDEGVLTIVKQSLGLSELYPVHRLDKMTSGLLLLAKTPAANRQLSMQFAAREVEKYYLAIAPSKVKKKQGLVKGDMQASRRGSWKLLASQENRAISQFFSAALTPGLRLFLLKPHTGKTHQLRVALKSLGAPIVGDRRYAGQQADRGYLHAYSLGFCFDGQDYRYLCPPSQGQLFTDDSFNQALHGYAEPWTLSWPRLTAK